MSQSCLNKHIEAQTRNLPSWFLILFSFFQFDTTFFFFFFHMTWDLLLDTKPGKTGLAGQMFLRQGR